MSDDIADLKVGDYAIYDSGGRFSELRRVKVTKVTEKRITVNVANMWFHRVGPRKGEPPRDRNSWCWPSLHTMTGGMLERLIKQERKEKTGRILSKLIKQNELPDALVDDLFALYEKHKQALEGKP